MLTPKSQRYLRMYIFVRSGLESCLRITEQKNKVRTFASVEALLVFGKVADTHLSTTTVLNIQGVLLIVYRNTTIIF